MVSKMLSRRCQEIQEPKKLPVVRKRYFNMHLLFPQVYLAPAAWFLRALRIYKLLLRLGIIGYQHISMAHIH